MIGKYGSFFVAIAITLANVYANVAWPWIAISAAAVIVTFVALIEAVRREER